MSGHSHWSSIKHRKALADTQKGKIFSKLAREITIAAKEKGGDPETNPALRLAIEKAKGFNMPSEKIEKAIKRGSGELEGEALENVRFGAFGPGNIAIIIEGITDNKNRALSEIKQVLNQNSGKLTDLASVQWLFERKGILSCPVEEAEKLQAQEKEALELKAIEAGAEDLEWGKNILEVYTKIEDLEKVKNALEQKGVKVQETVIGWKAKEEIQINNSEKEKALQLFEALGENEIVQEIYSNLKL